MPVNFFIPWEGILVAYSDDELIRELANDNKVPYRVEDFNKLLKEPKLMIVTKPENMKAVVKRSKTFENDKYKSSSLITASTLYEYMDPRISKTYGLKQIMAMHNIDMKDLCTFGDADNDYDMTLNVGIGVVMANGSEKTKSVADFITDDNNNDGVANFINKYILEEE